MKLENCIDRILNEAKKYDCQADLLATQVESTSANVRNFTTEKLEESSFAGITFRLIKDKRTTSVKCEPSANIEQLVLRAFETLKHIPQDKYVSLAETAEIITDIHTSQSENVPNDTLKNLALRTEQIAHLNGKLKTTETIEFKKRNIKKMVANTNGFRGIFENQLFSAMVSVVAEKEGQLNSGYSYITSNSLSDLNPEELGIEAEKRAVEGLLSRKIPTCKGEVILDPRCASAFLGNFASFLSGEAVSRSATFLKNYMGKIVLPSDISIFNNPESLDCKIATPKFDDEGNQTSKQFPLIKEGVLTNWILDQYNANKLNLTPNGLAKRNINGSISPSVTNIYLTSKRACPEAELIGKIKKGIYVTNMFSCGVNPITGDYSQGAQGLWIENGKPTFPVSEITIAGQLKDIFQEIIAADNIKFFGRANAPSLYLGLLSISGT